MAKPKASKSNLGYNELKAEIREGSCRNLYVLTGNEDFLIDRLVSSLSELLIAPGCESLDRVLFQVGGQAARLDPENLKAEVLTPPFLSKRKLIVVRQSGWFAAASGAKTGAGSGSGSAGSAGSAGVGSTERSDGADRSDSSDRDRTMDDRSDSPSSSGDSDDGETAFASAATSSGVASQTTSNVKSRQEFLTNLFGNLPDSACLVFVESKVDKRLKSLVNAIESAGILADIGRQQPKDLLQWVYVECKRRSLAIGPDAAQSLIDRCDGSMTVLWQEMSKLFLYCTYAGVTQVDLALVDLLSLPDLRGTIFDLTDALSAGQAGRALQLADLLISQKTPVQLIQFMLARHLRQLICAAELGKPEQIASELKVMPFVASRLAGQARKMPLAILEDLYGRCFEMDVSVKSGRIGDRLALETLLVTAAEQLKR